MELRIIVILPILGQKNEAFYNKIKIKELTKVNKYLGELVDYFKDLFDSLINFIKHKIFGKGKKPKESTYMNMKYLAIKQLKI